MGALLDEMACLTRDFMVLKTAPREGISMLSGVATEKEVMALAERFSSGALVRMLGLIQQTAAGFTRSASRRLDAELCVVNLCQPELVLDAQALNARITDLEDQIRSGSITVKAPQSSQDEPEEEYPPVPDDRDAPPDKDEPAKEAVDEAPIGFWTDISAQVHKELKPPASGFFVPTPNAPVQGNLQGDVLTLVCLNDFTVKVINKPEILDLIARKASAKLGRSIRVRAVDKTTANVKSEQMEQLLQFGRAHSDIIKIKEN